MEIKRNWREYVLIALGVLIIIAPWVAVDTVFGWANVVLGIAVVVVGSWPFIQKFRQTPVV